MRAPLPALTRDHFHVCISISRSEYDAVNELPFRLEEACHVQDTSLDQERQEVA